MKTIQKINEEIKNLVLEKKQVEEATLEQTLLGMFAEMTKEKILEKIKEMMSESTMLKSEVKRLLLDNISNNQ